MLYLGSDETDLEVFELVSKNFDTVPFFHTNDQELSEYYDYNIILLKTFDEGRNDFQKKLTFDNLVKFVNKHRFATIMEFDDDASEKIFQGKNKCMFLFKADDEEGDKAFKALKEASKKLKGKILMAYTPIDADNSRLADFFGVTADMLPTIRIVEPANEYKKYKMDKDIELTSQSIKTFYNRYKRRKVKNYLKSEPIPY